MNFSGKKILILGLGVSGLWSVRFLTRQGAQVAVSEMRPERDMDPEILKEMASLGVRVETGGHTKKALAGADMIIVSPGVPHDSPFLARARGIPLMGELELAGRLIKSPIIAITGTNGKSTVTRFIGSMIENAGFRVFVGGNLGTPLMALAASGEAVDYAVVEVSSFQLDTIDQFSPLVSIILNISPDHLDRYPEYETYVQSKLRIFKNQGAGQYLILNDDDERLASIQPPAGVSLLRYGIEKAVGRQAFVEENGITVHLIDRGSQRYSLASFRLPGTHNLGNLMSCILVGSLLTIAPPLIQKTIDSFQGLPDRLELVGEAGGVSFYNDSKATNVDAAVKALTGFQGPLILIAGGRHKGAEYAPLVRAAEGKVKKAVFLGEAKGLLAESFRAVVPFEMAEDMEDAVSIAFGSAEEGDTVLLAPACSSFDMYSDYAQRGRAFKVAVKRLLNG